MSKPPKDAPSEHDDRTLAEPVAHDLSAPRLRPSRIAAVLAVILLVGAVVGFMLLVYLGRDRGTALSFADVSHAAMRWDAADVDDYDVRVRTIGERPTTIELEVRDGVPAVCLVNGQPPRQKRVWKSWLVPQQFDYIRDDLRRMAEDPERKSFAQAEFDPVYGIPLRYEFVSPDGHQLGWEIERFEPREK